MTAAHAITLRPAREEDMPLLRRVYDSTREVELAMVPWTPEQKEAFLAMQFRAQHTDYHRNYPDASYDVVECDGRPAGRLYVHRRPAALHILDIALLPESRGAGIGTVLLERLFGEAAGSGKPVSIHVEKQNPAMRLYRRLGFVEIEDVGLYLLMQRPS